MPNPNGYDKRSVFAWALYDFANSSYHSLVLTFIFSTFFAEQIAPNRIIGTAMWSRGVTVSAFIVAVLSPLMGALADAGGYRKRILFSLTWGAALGTAALYTASPGQPLFEVNFWLFSLDANLAIIIFVITNIMMELAVVFYNSFLPDIAPSDKIGRISGYGWGFGYVGGLLAMLIAMVGFVEPETPWFGISKEASEHIRATNILVAVWFLVFSTPLFLWVKESRPGSKIGLLAATGTTFRQLASTFKEIRQYREIVRFLLARIFYNDGLITIFAFGGIYAKGTFGFEFKEILWFGIVLNITAGIGAAAFGFLDDRIGGKQTIQITNIGFMIASLAAVLAPDKQIFWLAGIVVGIFSGPNQAASRSLLGRFVPKKMENEFYGFYAFSGKATAFLGPLTLGILTEVFESQRAGMVVVVILFLLGAIILSTVDEEKGRALRTRETA